MASDIGFCPTGELFSSPNHSMFQATTSKVSSFGKGMVSDGGINSVAQAISASPLGNN